MRRESEHKCIICTLSICIKAFIGTQRIIDYIYAAGFSYQCLLYIITVVMYEKSKLCSPMCITYWSVKGSVPVLSVCKQYGTSLCFFGGDSIKRHALVHHFVSDSTLEEGRPLADYIFTWL